DVMHRTIKRVLARPDMQTLVAFESKDPTFVYGFIAGDTSDHVPVVFYLYVKTPFRRMGMARSLFAALGVDPSRRFIFTCKTAAVAGLTGKIPYAKFNPAVPRYPKEQAA